MVKKGVVAEEQARALVDKRQGSVLLGDHVCVLDRSQELPVKPFEQMQAYTRVP